MIQVSITVKDGDKTWSWEGQARTWSYEGWCVPVETWSPSPMMRTFEPTTERDFTLTIEGARGRLQEGVAE